MPSHSNLFWRVEDEGSQAVTTDDGIYSASENAVDFIRTPSNVLGAYLSEHLDWNSNEPSPFISTYKDETWAFNEAGRRKRDYRRQNVTVTEIDLSRLRRRIQYRHVVKLAQKLRVKMKPSVWDAADAEYIFANHIPKTAVVAVYDV